MNILMLGIFVQSHCR